MSEQGKVSELRDRVEGSRRNLPLASLPDREPPEDYRALAADYPIALVASGLVAGVVAGALLPRGIGRRVARGTISAALLAGEYGRTYGKQAASVVGEVAKESRQKVDELSQTAGTASRQKLQGGRDLGIRALREAIRFAASLRR